jgi:hypothetical protein
LAQTSSRLCVETPAKTIRQLNEAPISAPIGAPNESEINKPDTTIESRVAR